MQEAVNPGEHVRRRVAEKRKVSNAQEGIGKLMLMVGGLVFLSLLAMSTRFVVEAMTAPTIIKLGLPVLMVLVFLLWRARRVVRNGDLQIAAALVWTSALVGGLALLMLMTGIFDWSDDIRSLPRLASAGLMTFLILFSVAYVVAIVVVATISNRLRAYEMHSLNMGPLDRAMYFWCIILGVQVLLSIIF